MPIIINAPKAKSSKYRRDQAVDVRESPPGSSSSDSIDIDSCCSRDDEDNNIANATSQNNINKPTPSSAFNNYKPMVRSAIQCNVKSQNISNGEIRSAAKGIMSSRSMELFSKARLAKLDEEEDTYNDVNNSTQKKKSSMRDALIAAAKKNSSKKESDTATPKRSGSTGGSNAAKSKWGNIINDTRRASLEDSVSGSSWGMNRRASISDVDILTEGQHYLSISMMVYMYSHLRETCRMGHTRVTFEELDVNSFQSLYGRGPAISNDSSSIKYLNKTKTSGSIVNTVINELGCLNEKESNEENNQDLMGGHSASREYELSMLGEFKGWIEDSKVSQLDASTEEVINNLKKQVARRRWKRAKSIISMSRMLSKSRLNSDSSLRSSLSSNQSESSLDVDQLDPNKAQMVHHLRRQVARYRWRRAITRVLLAVRLSRPGCPSWNDHPETDDDDGNNRTSKPDANAFVDVKKLMNVALKEQPKFFRDGSVMKNLIESGIEVVWFSDLTQSDVVYGICCQREEERVTVVFRGTVNSHNWLINMKYGTNRIRNPVRDTYHGREDVLDIHTGFSLYMLRRRKDTQMSKVSWIFICLLCLWTV